MDGGKQLQQTLKKKTKTKLKILLNIWKNISMSLFEIELAVVLKNDCLCTAHVGMKSSVFIFCTLTGEYIYYNMHTINYKD